MTKSNIKISNGEGRHYEAPDLEIYGIDVENGFAFSGWNDGALPEDGNSNIYDIY